MTSHEVTSIHRKQIADTFARIERILTLLAKPCASCSHPVGDHAFPDYRPCLVDGCVCEGDEE